MKNTSWAFKNHFSTLSSPARRVLNPFHKQNEPQSRENSPKSDAFLMKINKVEVGDDKHELKKKKKYLSQFPSLQVFTFIQQPQT